VSAEVVASAIETPSLIVTTTSDGVDNTDGQTSLREALTYAAQLGGAQTVKFNGDPTVGSVASGPGIINFYDAMPDTITLGGELVIASHVTIAGSVADRLTLSGSDATRVLRVTSGATAVVSKLTVANGKLRGNVGNFGTLAGAGIFNEGNLTLQGAVVRDSRVIAAYRNFGGGIYNAGTLTLAGSSLADNLAGEGRVNRGAGLYTVTGAATVVNSTLAGNTVRGVGSGTTQTGAGIYNEGTLILGNSTLAGNAAAAPIHFANDNNECTLDTYDLDTGHSFYMPINGNGCDPQDSPTAQSTFPPAQSTGGGVFNAGTATVRNALVAANTSVGGSPDFGGSVTSQGNNLIGQTNGSTGWVATDLTGTAAAPVSPQLGPLQNNGGPTFAMALLPGSPAIDASDPAFDPNAFTPPLTTDQRGAGYPRIFHGTVDIGAFEFQGAAPQITSADHVTFTTGSAGTFAVTATGFPTPALIENGALPSGVTFVDNGDGTATLSGTPATGTRSSYPLTFKAANGVAPDATQSFTLTVGNAAPIAPEQTFVRGLDLSLKIRIADVLAACGDADGDTLALDSVGASAQGAAIARTATHLLYSLAANVDDSFAYTISDGHGGVTTGLLEIQVINPGGLVQTITTSSGTVNLAGIPGFSYHIERATDLAGPWVRVDTQIAPARGLFHYTDPSPPQPSAYYRLLQTVNPYALNESSIMKNISLFRLVVLLVTSGVAQAVPYTSNWSSGFLNSGAVPDGTSTGWSDTRTLSGIAQNSILDLNVTLQLSGGWNGDLYAYLTHGTGFSVLLNRVGRTGSDAFGYGDAGMNVTFDDTAANRNIHLYGAGLITGGAAWQPDGRDTSPLTVTDLTASTAFLSSFNGLDPNGDWTLFVADLSNGELSTVLNWGLNFDVQTTSAPSVPDGGATLLLLSCGLAGLGILRRIIRG